MRIIATLFSLFIVSFLLISQLSTNAQVQPPPPPNPPTPVVAGIVGGAPVSGCAAQSVLFVKSTSTLGCNAPFASNDAGTQITTPPGSACAAGANGLSIGADTYGFWQALNKFSLCVAGTSRIDYGASTAGFLTFNSGISLFQSGVSSYLLIDSTAIEAANSIEFAFSSNGSAVGSIDVNLSRNAPGVIQIGTTTNNANGDLLLSGVIYGGSVPTVAGSCGSFGTPVGGNTNGTISSSAICAGASTITLTFAFTAPTGWNCAMVDRTTATALIRETGTTPTVVTFTVGAVATAANDVLQYGPCGAY